MIEYRSWSTIPETLATKAALRKRGLKPAKGQQPVRQAQGEPVAYKVGGYGPYDLFLVVYAVPIRKTSPAQLATLAKARELIRTFVCVVCGERHDLADNTKGGRCYDCNRKYEAQEMAAFASVAREDASAWARTMLTERALILDTETTGLDDEAEIVQIAIIDTSGTTLLDSLVLPSHFPATYHKAEAIHGISRERLTDAPTILNLWPQILAILDHAPHIVVYNADFDFRLLHQSLAAYGVQLYQPNWQIHCAMKLYAQYRGEYSTRHGSFTWQPLPGGDHTALGDCLATLSLLHQMAKTAGDNTQPTNQPTN